MPRGSRRTFSKDRRRSIFMPRSHFFAATTLAAVLKFALLPPSTALAQMAHGHDGPQHQCAEPALRCASTVTPTFAADGSLWLVWAAAGRVSVARSEDFGRSFTPAVGVNPEPLRLDTGPTNGLRSQSTGMAVWPSPIRSLRT